MIGIRHMVMGLGLVIICALAWRRQRCVGGKTWAFRIVPPGMFVLFFFVRSGAVALVGLGVMLLAYAVGAYRGGWRLSGPKTRVLRGIWWLVHVIVYYVMAVVVCGMVGIVGNVLRWTPLATEADWPWTEGRITEELPFAVEYKRAKTLCAEYDKRIRFKSGKTIGVWPDTGGGGPFAVYVLDGGEYYLIDGLKFDFIRSEYRVNCTNETVERKGKYSWILIPDGALTITTASDRDVMVATANGPACSQKTTPIGDSLKGRRFIGLIYTNGRFVAGGIDPLPAAHNSPK